MNIKIMPFVLRTAEPWAEALMLQRPSGITVFQ
jgi:hypothetical protein